MTRTDELLDNNAAYAAEFAESASKPRVAVVACMDTRLDVYALLGLSVGEAHVIRNAGGVITDDVIRSLSISQRLLGSREIVLVHHTQCGMLTFTDEEFATSARHELGHEPSWRAGAFRDLDDDVRASIAALRANPFVPYTDAVRGFVFDVATGRLAEVR